MNRFAAVAVGLTATLGIGVFLLFSFTNDGGEIDAGGTSLPDPATTAGVATTGVSTTLAVTSSTAQATTSTPATQGTTASSTTSTTTPTTTVPAPTSTAAPATTLPPPPPFSSSVTIPTTQQLSASWRPGCPVAVNDLRILTMTHWGYDGKVRTGKLVVAAVQANAVVGVFKDLYEARFPIERMELIEEYGGDDNASMAANNTSAFNCRPVTGGSSFSEHSYGHAVDINPLVNPYVKGSTILPPGGAPYVDRSKDATGMIHTGDEVVTAFSRIGWIWGGTWNTLKDYQHFSATGR